ncbi:MAG: hypothetical protein LBC33_00580 [Mycoplasmataceae bacterium]|nr:hypothetical protein [Mycoplasmataceae bacterium]
MTVPTEKSPAVAVLIKTNSNLSDDWLVIKSVDDNHKVATVKNLNIVIDVAKINNHWDIMIATICAYNIQKSVGLQGSRDILCSVAKRSDLLNPSFHVITFNYELTE